MSKKSKQLEISETSEVSITNQNRPGYKQPRFKTPYNASEFPDNGERSYLPSLTIPDQSMTISEILKRHTRGLPIQGARVPLYEEDTFDNITQQDFARLDLADQEQLIMRYREELDEIKAEANKKAKELRERQAEAHLKKVTEAREKASKELEERQKQAPGTGASTNIS